MISSAQPKKFNSGRIYFLSITLFVFIFLLTRLPYYIYYPFAIIKGDSSSYFCVAFDFINSGLPSFDQRTPGYPVFILFAGLFSDKMIAISILQSIFTLVAGIFFLTSIYFTYKKYLILFSLAISVFISSSFYILFEFTILTEAVFVNFLIISCGLLIPALKEKSVLCLSLFSVTVGILNMIRPAAVFFTSIFILLVIFFIINKFAIKYYAALILPVLIFIISLGIYNSITIKSFSILPVANLSGATIMFMETSPEYPPYVNEAITKVLDTIPKKEKAYVRESFGSTKLFNIYWNNFNRWMALVNYLPVQDSSFRYMDIQHIMRQISIDAIKKHPDAYLRFIYCNFIQYFRNISATAGFYNELKNNYESTIFGKKYVKELEDSAWRPISSDEMLKEKVKAYYENEISIEKKSGYIITTGDNKIEFRQTFLKSVYDFYEVVFNFLFRNIFWILLFVITFAFSIYKLVKSGYKSTDAFIVFIFGMILISKALLVSMVDSSTIRFSYPVEFVIYLSLPFLFILLRTEKADSSK